MLSNNMYNDYDNETFDYYTTSTFDNRIYKYLLSRYQPSQTWNYRDTIDLKFDIASLYTALVGYAKVGYIEIGKEEDLDISNFEITFYTDKFYKLDINPVIEIDNEGHKLVVHIDYDISSKYFLRGTYYCEVNYVTYKTVDEDKKVDTFKTIVPMNDYLIYVV